MSNILNLSSSGFIQTNANDRFTSEIATSSNLIATPYGSKVKERIESLYNNCPIIRNASSLTESIISTELVIAAINNTSYDSAGSMFSKLSPNINNLNMEGSLSIGYSGTDLITKLQSSVDGMNGGKLQLFTKEDGGGSLTEKITITSDGKVGVGTTTPSEKLSINGGNLRIKNDYNDNLRQSNIILEENNGDGNVVIQYNGFSTSDSSKFLSIGSEYTGWVPVGSGLNYSPSDGKLGIGTYPTEKLEVNGTIKVTPSGQENPTSNGLYVYNPNNSVGQDSIIAVQVAGTSAGDPFISFDVSGETGWSVGMDNSDSNKFKISNDWNQLANNTKLEIDTSGNTTVSGSMVTQNKVGINTPTPLVALHITQFGVEDLLNDNGIQPDLNDDNNSAIRIQYSSNHWDIAFANNDKNLHFLYNSANRGWLNDTFEATQIDFTGQHRSSSSIQFTDNHVGLIVSSTGTYNNLSDDNSPSIDEAIPIVELSVVQNDKKVFGVISNNEGKTREYHQGIFVSVASKNADDNRLIINSLGEGGIWVCNINGNLENGDYVTSSGVGGYGMKQDDDLLHNYTVAKITCDCDFNNVNDSNDSTLLRYLDTTGSIITSEEYSLNGGYIAVFVGCTYHCG